MINSPQFAKQLHRKLKTEGGFSASTRGAEPKVGYMVSLPGTEMQIRSQNVSPAHIQEFIDKHGSKLGGDKYVGGWDGGKEVSLDISQNVKPSSKVQRQYGRSVAQADARERAITLGEARNQEAIWDVAKGREIRNPHFKPKGRRTGA